MKIMHENIIPEFEPVSLVLETKDELELFLMTIGSTSGNNLEDFGDTSAFNLGFLYNSLLDAAKQNGINEPANSK